MPKEQAGGRTRVSLWPFPCKGPRPGEKKLLGGSSSTAGAPRTAVSTGAGTGKCRPRAPGPAVCNKQKNPPPNPQTNQVRDVVPSVREYLLSSENCQGYEIQISHRELHSLNKFLLHQSFTKKVSADIFKE